MSRYGKLAVMIAIALPVACLFWIVLVGTFSAHELEVGILATLLAATGTAAIELQYPSHFTPSLRELLACWRLPGYLLAGTWEIMKIAAADLLGIRHAESWFRALPFAAGKKNDERAVARRVLAVTYSTATPTSIVLGINTNEQKLLVHELRRSPVSQMLKALGART